MASSPSLCWWVWRAAIGLAIQQVCRGSLVGAAVEILLIAVLVAQRSLFEHVAEVARALDQGGLSAGRDAVRHIVGRDPMSLDAYGVARAAIESLAENFSDGVVAPVFWYLLLGLPGLLAYKMANTLDSMIGHKTPALPQLWLGGGALRRSRKPGAGANQRAADHGSGAVC